MTTPNAPARNRWRSTGAVLFGLVAVFVLSLGTDHVRHVLAVYPPWGEPMYDTRLLLLALAYRCVYGALGSYIAARFAPHNPMRHALILGAVGFVLSSLGAIVAITMVDVGPIWYPVVLALTALPCAWMGGMLHPVAERLGPGNPRSFRGEVCSPPTRGSVSEVP